LALRQRRTLRAKTATVGPVGKAKVSLKTLVKRLEDKGR
jgi:hypothetical protein